VLRRHAPPVVVNTWLRLRNCTRHAAANTRIPAINRGVPASINPSSNRSNFTKIPAAFALNVRKNSNEVFKPLC